MCSLDSVLTKMMVNCTAIYSTVPSGSLYAQTFNTAIWSMKKSLLECLYPRYLLSHEISLCFQKYCIQSVLPNTNPIHACIRSCIKACK